MYRVEILEFKLSMVCKKISFTRSFIVPGSNQIIEPKKLQLGHFCGWIDSELKSLGNFIIE